MIYLLLHECSGPYLIYVPTWKYIYISMHSGRSLAWIFMTQVVNWMGIVIRTLVKSAWQKNKLLISHQNICCGYSKETPQWDGSFEHPKHMLKLWVRKYWQFYAEHFCYLNMCLSYLTQCTLWSLYHAKLCCLQRLKSLDWIIGDAKKAAICSFRASDSFHTYFHLLLGQLQSPPRS